MPIKPAVIGRRASQIIYASVIDATISCYACSFVKAGFELHVACTHKLVELRATSHKRLRARDHYTSSTLIGGKGGAGPSLLHTTLEGPTEHANARWMSSLHRFIHGTKWIMVHGHLDCFQKPHPGGLPDTKAGDHGTPNTHNR